MKTYCKRTFVSCMAIFAIGVLTSQQVNAQHHHHHRSGVHHGGAHYAGHYSARQYHSHGLVYGGYGYYPAYATGYSNSGVIYSAPPVVSQNVPPTNALPQAFPVSLASDSGTIMIVNPSDSGGEVRYTLNGTEYSIKPGQTQTVQNDRPWTVSFGSGGAAGDVRYALKSATYKFRATKVGWNLFKAEEPVAIEDYPPAPTPQFDVPTEEPRSVLIPITQP